MNAFAAAVGNALRRSNIGRDAVADGGAPVLVRVVADADAIPFRRCPALGRGTTRFDLSGGRDRRPGPGDRIVIDDVFMMQGEPVRPRAAGLDRRSEAGETEARHRSRHRRDNGRRRSPGERLRHRRHARAGTGLKPHGDCKITGAGLGARLANSIRNQNFPKAGEPRRRSGLVRKAPVIVGAHDTGPLIRSKNGFWLAIPTPAAGKGLRAAGSHPVPGKTTAAAPAVRLSPDGAPACWWRRGAAEHESRAVVSRFLETGRGQVTAPIFLLVPQVKLPSGSTWRGMQSGRTTRCQGLIVANWVEKSQRDASRRTPASNCS